MPSTLVECVPNFSEGREKAKVDDIVDAMRIPGVYLLDREMDVDHNRCVITLVGEREPIQEAAIRGVGKAAELIDLNNHQGAHPRMGATDVVPFIPIDGVTLMTAWPWRGTWARKSGSVSDSGLSLRSRRGDARAAESGKHSPRPVRRHSRGDCHESRAQARFRRASRASHGRRHSGRRAQISDRLQRLPEYAGRGHRKKDRESRALFKRRPALRQGRGIPGARHGAGLDEPDRLRADSHPSRLRIREARSRALWRHAGLQRDRRPDSEEGAGAGRGVVSASGEFRFLVHPGKSPGRGDGRKDGVGGLRAGVEPFIEQLAAPTATPGGGSAAAASGAMAAGLASMVASMSRGKKAYVQYESQLSEAIARLGQLREELKSAIDADAESYNLVMKAYKSARSPRRRCRGEARSSPH